MDLRNFFKPKNAPTAAPSQEKPKPKAAPEKKQAGTRRKTVIPDSDEDDDPAVEVQSKHFSSSGTKPAPAKPRIVEEGVDPKAFFASSKTTKAKSSTPPPAAAPAATARSHDSKRVESVASPVKEPVKEVSVPAKRAKKAVDEDYFEDDSDVEIIPKPTARATKSAAKAPEPKPQAAAPEKKAVEPYKVQASKRKAPRQDDEDDAYSEKEEPRLPVKRVKKKPLDDDAMDVDEPKEEKPKPKFNYWAHKNKAGPSALGSKEIPIGKANCLAGLTFVFTGELSSITREDAADLVKRYCGRVTGSPSGKTSYVVVGDDAGESKLQKVKALQIKTLDEDQFLELIATSPAKTPEGVIVKDEPKASSSVSAQKKADTTATHPVKSESASAPSKSSTKSTTPSMVIDNGPVETDLWTTKYKPRTVKDLCGNNAAIQKLQRWLENWDANYKLNFKKENADKTGTFRAVLISGSPGVGKTSAAHLVGEAVGYSIVEFNASDTRSKKSLDSEVRDLLNNQTLGGYFTGEKSDVGKGKAAAADADPTMAKKQLIIMDEVDGMAGGDRGGVAQLIAFIKKTQVPIICICNDRQSPKVRSLVNSCVDLRFQKPQVAQVRSRLLTILHREGRKVPANVLDKLVSGSQSDIRQVLNMLSTWSLTKDTMDYDEGTALSKASEKYVAMNPFQIAEQLLVESNYRALSLGDKFDAYFNDYQLAPLMIQENYVRMNPTDARGPNSELDSIELMSKAADSLSDADLVDTMIHGSAQQWSLMPVHAAFSCVRPASFVHGGMRPGSGGNFGPMMQFPSYLGQFSKASKYNRLVKEIQIRMRLKISGDKNEVRQSYLPALFPALTQPLLKQGVDAVEPLIEFMDSYYLSKEDWDTILELGIGRNDGQKVLDNIPTATKSAFTRMYNKNAHPQPFLKATAGPKVSRGSGGGGAEETPDNLEVVEADAPVPDEVDESAEKEEEESIEKDKNIKQKKAKAKGKAPAKGRK
ncbi:replication factor C subunit 1 [Entomortierella parvispora]|uniref:Replication factor C subunit 1 n=1 Tax=Entomortierella parvispora TaxID=205924 RepID=A0A9P3H4P3_9FUNG|nr:replication factor C subunit 1 [Entomortierella parvispora]